jgi:predicted RNA methylase
MKNYFNQYEASNHLIMMTAMLSVKNLIDGDCITEEERKMLKKVLKLVDEFSASVFERLGDGYKRSIINKGKLNTLRVVSRNIHHINFNADMEDFIDSETLLDMIDLSASIECEMCNKTEKECLTCGWYKVKSYLHHKGENKNDGLCPFRKEQVDLPQIDFEDF